MSFSPPRSYRVDMKTVRKALRDKELVKDTYQRVNCAECEKPLKTKNDPDTITTIRICPDCGKEWKSLR